ncbi:MAG: hypothetical protein MI919_10705, partial [Holophagales bacterium]|nr:hypothetical protein [Holophagales bacterium]
DLIENIVVAGNTISNSSQMPGAGNVHHAVGMIIKQGLARNIVITDNVTFDDQLSPTQGYAVSLNPGTRPASSAVANLYVDGNVSFGGLFTPALHPNVVATAVTTGNVP